MRSFAALASVSLCALLGGGCGAPDIEAIRRLDASTAEATTTDRPTFTDAPADTPPPPPPPPPMPDPGRVTLHRLNRVEYNNTVRDLLGTTRTPADDLPADDRGYGFDNIADVLSLSTVHLELYQRAVEGLLDEALANPAAPSTTRQYEAEALMGSVGAASGTAWNLWSNGDLDVRFSPPVPGTYRVRVRAWQTRGGTEDAQMTVSLDGVVAQTHRVPNLAAMPGEFVTTLMVRTAASATVSVGFINDYYNPTAMEDRNLLVDWIRIEGPLDAATRTNPQRERIMVCTPMAGAEVACARTIVTRFGRRAWRRPLTGAEVDELVAFLDVARAQGEGFEAGVRLALTAMLLSPHFLFRVELDPDPTSAVAHALNDHELAARLSYFLWSSMPDDALFALADAGTLHAPDTLRAQVTRMLADPKARAFTENFAGQWLYTRAVAEHDADTTLFPAYTAAMRASMRAETQAYFESFLRDDIGMDRFLTADFTWLDDTLARLYGVTLPAGTGMRRAMLPSTRRGFLTQASVLTVTSHPNRTSPVRRGQWVLNQLLCQPPSPPPPNVEGLPPETNPTGSLRDRLERHRANPECAACHDQMDPLGFAFEHFDAVGAWRTTDSGFAIDSTGTVPDTTDRFDGGAELAAYLARDPRYPRCVTQQVFTYALGRGPEASDQPTLDALTRDWQASGMRLRELLTRVVLSDAFLRRRGETAGGMR